MNGLSFWFFVLAVISGALGMAWGIQMSASGDHSLSIAHAHLNLIGWVGFAIFGIYYPLVPAAHGKLARRKKYHTRCQPPVAPNQLLANANTPSPTAAETGHMSRI